MKIRTRFAPSPTGYLHIGGARTALFAWLFARHYDGEFILRIEDTDRERSTEGSIQAIFQGMQWLGLDWDEEPSYQTQRYDRYIQIIEQLLQEDKAYRCYCSKERLEQLRNQQQAKHEKPRYDGLCREQVQQNNNQAYVVRFKNPQSGRVAWDDSVHGWVEFQNSELDDLIIQRSEGTPTYNFTVVVDDIDMQMTHILRGDDHINNTPKQINLFHALGATPPSYGHLPMILGSDGKRLSKRHGAVNVMQYKEDGYLSEALLNYLARLGWSHGDQEIFSRRELIELFNVKHINKSAATFNPQKLAWMNQQYLKNMEQQHLVTMFREYLPKNIDKTLDLATLANHQVARCSTLKEMVENSKFCFQAPEHYDEQAVKKHFLVERIPALQQLSNALGQLDIWHEESILQTIKTVLNDQQLKMGQLGPAVRIALTGNTQSPNLATTIYLIGQPKVTMRLQKAIKFIQ